MDDKTLDGLAQERGMKRLNRTLTLLIRIVAGVMGLAFAFLTLLDAPFDRLTQAFDTGSLMKAGLFLFFFGWVWGADEDTAIQAAVFDIDPHRGRLGVAEIGGLLAFLVVFLGLYALHDRIVVFQAALLLFICVNVGTWGIIVRRTHDIYRDNARRFLEASDNASYLRLVIVSDYMNGNWQRRRFAWLVGLAAAQLVLAVLVSNGIVAGLMRGITFKGISGTVWAAYLPGIAFLAYVVVSELWMKVYRIKVKADMVTVAFIDASYRISRQKGTPPPPLNLRAVRDWSAIANENYD